MSVSALHEKLDHVSALHDKMAEDGAVFRRSVETRLDAMQNNIVAVSDATASVINSAATAAPLITPVLNTPMSEGGVDTHPL